MTCLCLCHCFCFSKSKSQFDSDSVGNEQKSVNWEDQIDNWSCPVYLSKPSKKFVDYQARKPFDNFADNVDFIFTNKYLKVGFYEIFPEIYQKCMNGPLTSIPRPFFRM